MRILPGDPLAMIYGEGTGDLCAYPKLNWPRHAPAWAWTNPCIVQYLDWMKDVASGDLGHSFWVDTPIRDTFLRRGPITAQIALFSIVLAWVIGIPVGIISAVRRESWLDYIFRFFVTLFMAIPSFWLGLAMILFTVLVLNWRPSITIVQFWEDPRENFLMILGPTVAMGTGIGAMIARMTRTTVLETLREDYVRTARAKGLAEWTLLFRHVTQECAAACHYPLWAFAGRSIGRLGGCGTSFWLSRFGVGAGTRRGGA